LHFHFAFPFLIVLHVLHFFLPQVVFQDGWFVLGGLAFIARALSFQSGFPYTCISISSSSVCRLSSSFFIFSIFLVWVYERCGIRGLGRFLLIIFSLLLTALRFCFLFFLLFLCLERLDSAEGEISDFLLRNEWNTVYLINFPWNSFVYFCCAENHDGGLKHFRPLPPPLLPLSLFPKVSLSGFLKNNLSKWNGFHSFPRLKVFACAMRYDPFSGRLFVFLGFFRLQVEGASRHTYEGQL